MQQNAILTFFKLVAFTVLATMVFFTFWQQSKSEKVDREILTKVSQIADTQSSDAIRQRERDASIDRAIGAVEANSDAQAELIRNILDMGLRAPPTNGGGTHGATKPRTNVDKPKRPTTKTGQDGTRPPAYLSKEAKALWGTYPDYLEEDENTIPYADWETPGLDPSGRFKRWFGSAPSDINPITTSDGVVTTHIKMYCDESMAQQHDLNPSKYGPALAIRVEVNVPDYTEYIVFLRKGAKWHKPQVDLDRYPHLKGDHYVTSKDFKFTVDARKNEHINNASIRSYYDQCEGVEIIDDHCFILRWKKPQFQSISFTLAMPVAPHFVLAFDENGNEYETREDLAHAINDHWFYREHNYVGAGPFYMAEFDPSKAMLLRRFEEYYGKLPRMKEIYEEIFGSQDLNLKGFEGGQFDATDITAKQWSLKTQDKSPDNPFTNGQIETNWWWTPRYAFIGWNNEHPIFKDVDVRHAMTLACDRPRLRDVIQIGRAKIVTGPQPANSPFYPKDIEPLPFDLDMAKARLAKAGWKDTDGDGVLDKEIDGVRTPFKFTATIPVASDTMKAFFSIFREDLRSIGVDMKIDALVWKQFKEKVMNSRNFECTTLVWTHSGWEGDMNQVWHSSQADEIPSSNFIAFRDKQVDEWIMEARGIFDHQERIKIKHKLHKRLHELQPYTFLTAYQMATVSWKNRVGNARASTLYRTRPVWRLLPYFVKK